MASPAHASLAPLLQPCSSPPGHLLGGVVVAGAAVAGRLGREGRKGEVYKAVCACGHNGGSGRCTGSGQPKHTPLNIAYNALSSKGCGSLPCTVPLIVEFPAARLRLRATLTRPDTVSGLGSHQICERSEALQGISTGIGCGRPA